MSKIKKHLLCLVLIVAAAGAGCRSPGPLDSNRPDNLAAESIRKYADTAWNAFKRTHPPTTNKVAIAQIEAIALRLILASRTTEAKWEILAYGDGPVTAFYLPPARLAVHAGLWEHLEDGERAALIAHLLGHAQAVHGAERLGRILQDIEAGEDEPPPGASQLVLLAYTGHAAGGRRMAFTAQHEIVADALAKLYLKRAGYKADAIGELWEALGTPDLENSLFIQVHPMTPDKRSAKEH